MFQIEPKNIELLNEWLVGHEKFVLVTHSNPDGDTVGANLAMFHLLQKFGKKVKVITPDAIPDFLEWMPGCDQFLVFSNDQDSCKQAFDWAEVMICHDFNAAHRVGKMSHLLESFQGLKVMIDHHLFPDTAFFNLLFSFPESSSTSELLFSIIQMLGYEQEIDYNIALSLFVGIMTDTGSYSHSCDRSKVFKDSATLIDLGKLDVKSIHDKIYNSFSENRLRFLGYCISEKLVVREQYKSAYISLTNADMKKFEVNEGDTEGIVNYCLSINGIEFAILLKEKDDHIKLSFRSKGDFSVNKFSRDYFEGGGHLNAAGGKSFVSMEATIEKIEQLLPTINLK